LPFHAFKLGRVLLPDAVVILIVVPPADLLDTCPLLLFGYHLGEIVAQIFSDWHIRRSFADRAF